jgi:GTP cyclohydrolase I
MEFPYFLVKKAPVSGMESVMDYTARFDATATGKEIDFVLTVKVAVTTLCPCSKAIKPVRRPQPAGHGDGASALAQGHLDRGFDHLGESSASSELYSLLKRRDEKAVTERAYENPVFVEDLVRNVVERLNAHPDVAWYKVEAENFESIHSHNAYASIEKG